MKVVVIQTAFLGDVILTVPLLSLLRRDGRVSEATVVAAPPGAGFLENQLVADRVLTYDKRRADSGTAGLRRLVSRLRRVRADVALVPHRSFRSAFVALAGRVPRRVGFQVSGGRMMLTDRLPYEAGVHEVERVASLVRALGIETPLGRLPFELRVPQGEADALARTLADGPVNAGDAGIVVAPGSRWRTKRWLPERFAEAARTLAAETGSGVAIVGSQDETEVGAAVAARAGGQAIDLTGTLPLGQLLALVSGGRVVLSNDSAVTHIAAGLGTPVVTVFGPTVPAQGFAPYTERSRVVEAALDCRPCGKHGSDSCPLGTFECMEEVAVEDVVSAALELLGGKADGP